MGAAYGMLAGHETGPRPWGERLNETPFILHKGEAYLECFIIAETVMYEKDGQPIDASRLRLRQREEFVKCRCFKAENIQSLTLASTV
jgi:hypothetical protein